MLWQVLKKMQVAKLWHTRQGKVENEGGCVFGCIGKAMVMQNKGCHWDAFLTGDLKYQDVVFSTMFFFCCVVFMPWCFWQINSNANSRVFFFLISAASFRLPWPSDFVVSAGTSKMVTGLCKWQSGAKARFWKCGNWRLLGGDFMVWQGLWNAKQNGQVKQDFLLQSWWLFVSHSRKNGEESCARQIKGS